MNDFTRELEAALSHCENELRSLGFPFDSEKDLVAQLKEQMGVYYEDGSVFFGEHMSPWGGLSFNGAIKDESLRRVLCTLPEFDLDAPGLKFRQLMIDSGPTFISEPVPEALALNFLKLPGYTLYEGDERAVEVAIRRSLEPPPGPDAITRNARVISSLPVSVLDGPGLHFTRVLTDGGACCVSDLIAEDFAQRICGIPGIEMFAGDELQIWEAIMDAGDEPPHPSQAGAASNTGDALCRVVCSRSEPGETINGVRFMSVDVDGAALHVSEPIDAKDAIGLLRVPGFALFDGDESAIGTKAGAAMQSVVRSAPEPDGRVNSRKARRRGHENVEVEGDDSPVEVIHATRAGASNSSLRFRALPVFRDADVGDPEVRAKIREEVEGAEAVRQVRWRVRVLRTAALLAHAIDDPTLTFEAAKSYGRMLEDAERRLKMTHPERLDAENRLAGQRTGQQGVRQAPAGSPLRDLVRRLRAKGMTAGQIRLDPSFRGDAKLNEDSSKDNVKSIESQIRRWWAPEPGA